ncbi:hypothetical protein L207DRAFT_218666 [Hyaloscypha variabilis F]|uniref:Uncharacterized protein n=1 Tax=Hyaloscypha variabilis (strain UAMH 11265 / GT02V1 / F) TaxID=1149755 RepID=A0A2J6S7D4_HYAVF|nr:hypothetical protein L207DRAFT_218666 [Hyaloscypha variabilis F]
MNTQFSIQKSTTVINFHTLCINHTKLASSCCHQLTAPFSLKATLRPIKYLPCPHNHPLNPPHNPRRHAPKPNPQTSLRTPRPRLLRHHPLNPKPTSPHSHPPNSPLPPHPIPNVPLPAPQKHLPPFSPDLPQSPQPPFDSSPSEPSPRSTSLRREYTSMYCI